MSLIFIGSTDLLSAAHTSGFVEPAIHWLLPALSPGAVRKIHFLIRKCGHITEYALLASLLWRAIRSAGEDGPDLRGDAAAALFAWLLATLYAATDEFHQSFVPSRGASVEDVMIDATGAFCGLALILAWRALRAKKPGLPILATEPFRGTEGSN